MLAPALPDAPNEPTTVRITQLLPLLALGRHLPLALRPLTSRVTVNLTVPAAVSVYLIETPLLPAANALGLTESAVSLSAAGLGETGPGVTGGVGVGGVGGGGGGGGVETLTSSTHQPRLGLELSEPKRKR